MVAWLYILLLIWVWGACEVVCFVIVLRVVLCFRVSVVCLLSWFDLLLVDCMLFKFLIVLFASSFLVWLCICVDVCVFLFVCGGLLFVVLGLRCLFD